MNNNNLNSDPSWTSCQPRVSGVGRGGGGKSPDFWKQIWFPHMLPCNLPFRFIGHDSPKTFNLICAKISLGPTTYCFTVWSTLSCLALQTGWGFSCSPPPTHPLCVYSLFWRLNEKLDFMLFSNWVTSLAFISNRTDRLIYSFIYFFSSVCTVTCLNMCVSNGRIFHINLLLIHMWFNTLYLSDMYKTAACDRKAF